MQGHGWIVRRGGTTGQQQRGKRHGKNKKSTHQSHPEKNWAIQQLNGIALFDDGDFPGIVSKVELAFGDVHYYF
ncbi:hypothetical protein [Pseudomonas gregormendelii]